MSGRRPTSEHEWVIADAYGWRDFADAESELTRWVDDRAWITGDGPKTIFDAAVLWLRERRVLLPGLTTLDRLVARVHDEALQRFWDTMAAKTNASQARELERLLDVADGARFSDLERLRKGPTTASGKSMVAALDRVAEIAAIGLGRIDLSAVPHRRVVELARYGMAGKAAALRRRPYARKVATLLATVVYLEAKATDEALELFDVLMTTDLLARAHRQSRDDKVRRYPQLSKDAGRLAAAVAVLLQAGDWDGDVNLERIWDAIGTIVSRTELEAAVENITEVVPPPDADPDGEWRAALVERFGVVRRFLPRMCATIAFDATAEAMPVLDALRGLAELVETRPTKAVPTGYLDVRRVAADVVPPSWRSVVFKPGRPDGTVDRAGITKLQACRPHLVDPLSK